MSAQLLIPGLAHQITKGIEKGIVVSNALLHKLKKGTTNRKAMLNLLIIL